MLKYVAHYLEALQKTELLGKEATNSWNPTFSLLAESWCTFSKYLKIWQLKKKKKRPGLNSYWYWSPHIMWYKIMKSVSLHCFVFGFFLLFNKKKMCHRIHALNTDIFQKGWFCFYSGSEYKMNTSNAPFTQRPFWPVPPFNSSGLEKATLCNLVIRLRQWERFSHGLWEERLRRG